MTAGRRGKSRVGALEMQKMDPGGSLEREGINRASLTVAGSISCIARGAQGSGRLYPGGLPPDRVPQGVRVLLPDRSSPPSRPFEVAYLHLCLRTKPRPTRPRAPHRRTGSRAVLSPVSPCIEGTRGRDGFERATSQKIKGATGEDGRDDERGCCGSLGRGCAHREGAEAWCCNEVERKEEIMSVNEYTAKTAMAASAARTRVRGS